jgi:hypothetical protein
MATNMNVPLLLSIPHRRIDHTETQFTVLRKSETKALIIIQLNVDKKKNFGVALFTSSTGYRNVSQRANLYPYF